MLERLLWPGMSKRNRTLCWRDLLARNGPPRTIFHRCVRCSRAGVFNPDVAVLAGGAGARVG